MRFSEEYKKSAENMDPDRQTIDRMKAAVLRELQEHPDAPAQPAAEPRKPLPLRRIAYIGGAVAACAVITVVAVNIAPSLRPSNGMIESTGASAASMAEAAPETSLIQSTPAESVEEVIDDDIAEDAAADEIPDNEPDGGIMNIDSVGNVYGVSPDEAENPCAGGADSFIEDRLDDDSAYDAAATTQTPASSSSGDASKGHTAPSDNKSNSAPTFAEVTEDSTEEPTDDDKPNPESGWDGLPDDTAESSNDAGSTTDQTPDETSPVTNESNETCDAGMTEEIWTSTEDWTSSEESDDEANDNYGNPGNGGVPRIMISPQGWLTFNGERYDSVKNAAPPASTEKRYEAYAPTEGSSYYVVMNDSMLYLYDIRMNYLGGFIKR